MQLLQFPNLYLVRQLAGFDNVPFLQESKENCQNTYINCFVMFYLNFKKQCIYCFSSLGCSVHISLILGWSIFKCHISWVNPRWPQPADFDNMIFLELLLLNLSMHHCCVITFICNTSLSYFFLYYMKLRFTSAAKLCFTFSSGIGSKMQLFENYSWETSIICISSINICC